jgi:hypothetical protein
MRVQDSSVVDLSIAIRKESTLHVRAASAPNSVFVRVVALGNSAENSVN